jgi:hypothetical protein
MSARFNGTDSYVATEDLMMAVNAAVTLGRPLLVKGEPGTGKTQLAEEIAGALQRPLYRWHIKSTTKAQQGCTNTTPCRGCAIRSSARRRCTTSPTTSSRAGCGRRSRAKCSRCCWSTRSTRPTSSSERPAARARPHGVLRLRDAPVDQGAHRPIIVITSNNEKELPDAFLRRCFFHYIRFPDTATMERIVDVHFPELKKELLAEGADDLLQGARDAGPEEEALDLRAARLDQAAARRGHPAGSAARPGSEEGDPPLYGALLKNEQDVHLFEQLVFLHRRQQGR